MTIAHAEEFKREMARIALRSILRDHRKSRAIPEENPVKVFDLQGTCVDFYQPSPRMGTAVPSEWRGLYRASLDPGISGKRLRPGVEGLALLAFRTPSRVNARGLEPEGGSAIPSRP